MINQDTDFAARIKRVKKHPKRLAQTPTRQIAAKSNSGELSIARTILRPQLAFVLGVVALIAGRSIAMNSLMVEPSTEVLGLGEGVIVVGFLFVLGLMFGKSDLMSHGSLIAGASLAFLTEGLYIRLSPELMESLYNADYVALVFLNAR